MSLFALRLSASLLNARRKSCAQIACHLEPVSLVIRWPRSISTCIVRGEGLSLYMKGLVARPLFARHVGSTSSSGSTSFIQLYDSIEVVLLHLFSKPSIPDWASLMPSPFHKRGKSSRYIPHLHPSQRKMATMWYCLRCIQMFPEVFMKTAITLHLYRSPLSLFLYVSPL